MVVSVVTWRALASAGLIGVNRASRRVSSPLLLRTSGAPATQTGTELHRLAVDLPRGPERERVRDRDRTYTLRGSESRTLATVGAYGPRNLIHILLDNGVHDSTGGQATVSASVDFAAVALACGYQYAASCDTLKSFVDLSR